MGFYCPVVLLSMPVEDSSVYALRSLHESCSHVMASSCSCHAFVYLLFCPTSSTKIVLRYFAVGQGILVWSCKS